MAVFLVNKTPSAALGRVGGLAKLKCSQGVYLITLLRFLLQKNYIANKLKFCHNTHYDLLNRLPPIGATEN